MLAAALHLTIDAPWTGMEPLRLGCVPSGLGTPDRYLTIELAGCPLVRCDLYGWRSVESHTFEEVQAWSGLVVVGFGHRLYVIEPVVRKASSFNLGSYFGHLYPAGDYLLVASAERLFRLESGGTVVWRSPEVGIDGVVVHQVLNGVIHGEGEWDPPGGWKPFRLRLDTGQLA
jgi:hypothetical protein